MVTLRLASPFTDHAVLQRDLPVAVAGWGESGRDVRVDFAGKTASATVDAFGRWTAVLPPMSASKAPRRMTVSSNDESVTLEDVLVGEVWLASGQSNMEMPLMDKRKRFRDKMGALVSQWASNENLRVILSPWKDISGVVRKERTLSWNVATHEFLASNNVSALVYYFGRELAATLDVPVGIMAAYVGGTPIGPWVPDCGWESIHNDPFVVTNILPSIARRKQNACKRREWPAYPGDLWNELVASLSPYTVRGMIWYQGESNINENWQGQIAYSKNLRALVDGWRSEFGCPKMKFLFVELAPFAYPWLKLEADDDRLARLCDEQQLFATLEPDAHLACISDLGDVNDIHPSCKLEVALRLSGLAFQHVYGLPVRADSPRAVSARLIAPGKVEISLERGEGLYRWMHEVSYWTVRRKESSPIRFVDEKGRVVDCESVVENGKIVAASLEMPNPKYVTYLRRAGDEGNIYNGSSLPLGTFRIEVAKE